MRSLVACSILAAALGSSAHADPGPWQKIRMTGQHGTVVEINYQLEVTSLSEVGDFTSANPVWINVSQPGNGGLTALIKNENPDGSLVSPGDIDDLPMDLDRLSGDTESYSGLVATPLVGGPPDNRFFRGFENVGQTGHPPVHQELTLIDSTGINQVFRFDLVTGKELAEPQRSR